MAGQTTSLDKPVMGWQLKLGVALFVLSIVLPLASIPLVTAFSLSPKITASLSGALLMGAEILGIIAIAVMGKKGYVYIKKRVFGFIKKIGPPEKVGRLRYTIGLVMFSVPILFGWVSPYIAGLIPGFMTDPIHYAIGGDILFLVSLFVLGGEFWDKIRSLFIHNAEVRF